MNIRVLGQFLPALLILLWVHAQASSLSNSISGQVLDRSGLPVAGASLYAENGGKTQVTLSDLQGRFALEGLGDGAWKLTAYHGRLSSRPSRLALGGGSHRRVAASLDREAGRLPLRATARPAFQPGGPATAEFTFEIAPDEAAGEALLGRAELRAALGGLKPGEYELVLASPGAAYVGTFSVLDFGRVRRVVHTGGLAIQGADYLEAVSAQAGMPGGPRRL